MKVLVAQSCRLLAAPWTVALQPPPSMGVSRQEYWSELSFPFPGDLPDPGIEPASPASQADSLQSEPPGKPLVLEEGRGKRPGLALSWVGLRLGPHPTPYDPTRTPVKQKQLSFPPSVSLLGRPREQLWTLVCNAVLTTGFLSSQ